MFFVLFNPFYLGGQSTILEDGIVEMIITDELVCSVKLIAPPALLKCKAPFTRRSRF